VGAGQPPPAPEHSGATEEAARLLGVLADPDRLKVAAALALGAFTVADVAHASGLTHKAIEHALARLVAGGLVERDAAGYRIRVEDLQSAARAAGEERRRAEAGPDGAGAVVARFVKGGRLTALPTTLSKRTPVLDYIAQRFTPGRRYTEREVNEILGRFHDDYAALRRFLVDEGFLDRAEGLYWRSGGTFPVD
jgi:hypothetical protein